MVVLLLLEVVVKRVSVPLEPIPRLVETEALTCPVRQGGLCWWVFNCQWLK